MKLTFHDNPDEAVRKKCVELEKIRKSQGQAAYWHYTGLVLKSDPWFMMRVALEWAWLDEDLTGHNFIKHVATNWGEDLGVLFPRGHGKTLPMSGIIISAICNNPDISILEISRTDGNADKIGATIAEHLLGNDYLQQCFGRKYIKDGFLPSSRAECQLWGKDGYNLPWRKPRFDPTLLCISLKGAKAGKHPDFIWLDDPTELENNNELGWAHVESVIDGCKYMLNHDGFLVWTGTRWHDKDPLGQAVEGKLHGMRAPFKFIQYSCYVDDDPAKGPTYPRKKRWNMDRETGFSQEMLETKRMNAKEAVMFAAQMRNNPSPADTADIKIADICIYESDRLPKVGHVRQFGINITGGGLPIFNGFREHCDELKLSIPLVEVSEPKQHGVDKADRIIAAIQPITSRGKLYVKEWMLGDDRSRDNLAYELGRIRAAAHDDIADALHMVPALMANGLVPVGPEEDAHLYISVDLAYTEKKRSDYTVAIAVAIDHNGNHWVLDYDRFQLSSPTGIYDRLLKFYRKFEEPQTIRSMSTRKYPGAWR